MTGFSPYQPKEIAPTPGTQPQGEVAKTVADSYVPRSFNVPTAANVKKMVHEDAADRFKLDRNISRQLDLDRIQLQEEEARIGEEIEGRWQKVKEKAEVDGYTAGLEVGRKEAYSAEKPRIEEKLMRLEKVCQEIDGMRDQIFRANETFLMQVIAQVARMVTLKELQTDQEYLKRVIVSLLNQLGTKDDIRILVSETDKGLIESLHVSVEKEFGKLKNTVIEPGLDIKPGDCKIETKFGVVDASVQVQIDNILKTLQN